jgi:hypothetical protein
MTSENKLRYKLFLFFLCLVSVFISISSLLFLPVTAYLIATLLTNSNEFSFNKNKKAVFYFFGLILILVLVRLSKIV